MVTDSVMCELLDVVVDRLYCQSVRFCCLFYCLNNPVKFRTGLVTTGPGCNTALISCFSMCQCVELISQHNNMKMTQQKRVKVKNDKFNPVAGTVKMESCSSSYHQSPIVKHFYGTLLIFIEPCEDNAYVVFPYQHLLKIGDNYGK